MYKLKFCFENLDGCLWAVNDTAIKKFGEGVIDGKLTLSEETTNWIAELTEIIGESTNWNEAQARTMLPEPLKEMFNEEYPELLDAIREELNEEFEIEDRQEPL